MQSSKELLLQDQVNRLKEKLNKLEKSNTSGVHLIQNRNKDNAVLQQKKQQPRT